MIAKKSSSSEQKDEENPTPVEELSEKLEGLVAGDKEIKEQEEEVKREINYFEKIKYAKTSKNANKIDMDKYQQVKEKILKKSEPVVEVRKTKPISIEECVKLLKEQEKTVQVGRPEKTLILIKFKLFLFFVLGVSNEYGLGVFSKESIGNIQLFVCRKGARREWVEEVGVFETFF